MAFEIEWLKDAQNELDAEIAFVLNEFGFKAAQKAYLRIQDHINCLTTFPQIGTLYPELTYKTLRYVNSLFVKSLCSILLSPTK